MKNASWPVFALSLLLAACGSGGGGSPQTQSDAPPARPQPQADQAAANPPAAEGKQENKPEAGNPPAEPKPPAMPSEKQPEAMAGKNDSAVLEQLVLRNEFKGNSGLEYVKLVLDSGKTIRLDLLPQRNGGAVSKVKEQVETLRDSKGNLVGYYGFADLSVSKPSEYNPSEQESSLKSFYWQNAPESLRFRPEVAADKSLKYKGSMLYRYADTGNQVWKADVQAEYRGSDKSVNLQIFERQNEHTYWVLKENQYNRSQPWVKVEDDGRVVGYLHKEVGGKKTADAQFIGGFYGANGSVFTGTAQKEGEQAWEGVIGATLEK